MALRKPKEVADKLGVKRSTLDKWRSLRKNLAFSKIGGAVRYRDEDVDKLIASGWKPPIKIR